MRTLELERRAVYSRPWRESADAVDLHLALPDSVAAESVECVHLPAPETEADDAAAVGQRQDHLRGAVIGADLDPPAGSDQDLPFPRVADRLRARIVLPVRNVQPEVALPMGERAVGFDLIARGPLRMALRHGEQPLIGPVRQPGRIFQAGSDPPLLATVDEPHLSAI